MGSQRVGHDWATEQQQKVWKRMKGCGKFILAISARSSLEESHQHQHQSCLFYRSLSSWYSPRAPQREACIWAPLYPLTVPTSMAVPQWGVSSLLDHQFPSFWTMESQGHFPSHSYPRPLSLWTRVGASFQWTWVLPTPTFWGLWV